MGTTFRRKNKVLAEFLALDAFLQMAVGGGDDADVHLDGAVAADAFQFTFLKDAQQLGLDLRGDFADFVQQDGAVVGQFEPAFALGHGAGEGALFMAEKFALDEVFRDGGAIELDERGAGARALAVERARDQFLAGAALAGDQHGGLGAARLCGSTARKFLHGGALAQQFVAAFVLLRVAEVLR